MKHDAINYSFTPKEFKYMFFSRKICPQCGNKLKKRKEYETRVGKDINSKSNPFFVPSANVKCYIYSFVCCECGKTYSLSELANKKGGN